MEYSNISNLELWGSFFDPNNECSWHARNPYFTNTKIMAKDGDEFAIYWSGNISNNISANNKPVDKNFMFSALKGDAISSAERRFYEDFFNIASSIQIKNPSDDFTSPNSIKLFGEDTRKGGFDSFGHSHGCGPDDDAVKKLGLTGCVTDRAVKYKDLDSGPCSDEQGRRENYEECHVPLDVGNPLYLYRGILDGFSNNETELFIRHPEIDASSLSQHQQNYQNNSGGLDVTVIRKGCPYTNGERLEYAIFSDKDDIDNDGKAINVEWKSLPDGMLFGDDPIVADKKGNLYFRIKPLNAPSLDINDPVQERIMLNYGQGGMVGSYNFSLFKLNDSGFLKTDGPLRKITQSVIKTLFGGDRKTGAVEKIYDAIIIDNDFISIVQALLVLYFTTMGVGFILGVIQTSQTELVKRMVKVAFVVALLSETSWEFFSTGFFNIFIYGGIEIMSYVATGGLGEVLPLKPEELQKDPSLIFAIFDGLIVQIFSSNVWIKIGTYAISGLVGLVTALVITISLLTYVLALLKAFLMYLMALIMIAVLIVSAPIFIPMVLFQFTKQFFDLWWKMLISFTLQPVAVFSSIAMFNMLIAICIYQTLSYTVCPLCYFKITIPAYGDVCILPWYQLLFSSHLPEGVTAIDLPGNMVTSAIILMILTGAMYVFVEYISRVVAMIINIEVAMRGGSLEGYPAAASNFAKGSIRSTATKLAAGGGHVAGQTRTGFAQGLHGKLNPKKDNDKNQKRPSK